MKTSNDRDNYKLRVNCSTIKNNIEYNHMKLASPSL